MTYGKIGGLDSITLRFTQDDGSVIDETVSLDFTDVPLEVLARAATECAPDDALGMAAILVHSRLSDSDLATTEMLKGLFEEMTRGEGVASGF